MGWIFCIFTIFILLNNSLVSQTCINNSNCIKQSVRHSTRVIIFIISNKNAVDKTVKETMFNSNL